LMVFSPLIVNLVVIMVKKLLYELPNI
jgi:hypothetical protein